MCFISDAAKSKNTAEDMIIYTALESAAYLTVKFHMNPVSNYIVHWCMENSKIQNTIVRDTVKDNQVTTTYFIPHVTKKELGNYTVRIINSAITNQCREVVFYVMLKLRGKKNRL